MYAGTQTDEQLAATDRLRDDWMTTALSTQRCDRPAAEHAVREAYTAAGMAPPPIIIWMDSPLGGVFAKTVLVRHISQPKSQLRDQLRGQLWDQLRDQLRGQLRGQLGDQLRDQLWDQLGDQLGDQLRDQLRDQLGDQLWDQLRDQLGDQLWDQLRGQLWDQLRGHLDPWYEPYWLALYTRAFNIAGLPASHQLETLAAAVWTTGWWWPMRGAVVLTDRPTVLRRDQQGRLHCETGPALAYTDGYDGHWWHGTRIPADLVAGDGWAPDQILRERNAEVRRCAIEKRGWDRFVVDAGLAQVGPAEPDPGNPGRELRLYDLPAQLADLYNEPARILVCDNASPDRDGTRRTFGLPVPADIGDPVTAAATTFGVSRSEYADLARAT